MTRRMSVNEALDAGPDEQAALTAPDAVTVRFTRAVTSDITLSWPAARLLLGLGGTSDEQMPDLMALLLTERGQRFLLALLNGQPEEIVGETSFALVSLRAPDGEQFWPEY